MQLNNNQNYLAVLVCVAFMAVTYLQPAEAFGPITLTLGTTAVVLTGTQVLISFCVQIFHTKVFCAAILYLQLGFVFFGKNFAGDNFTNILWVDFLSKSVLRSYSLLTVWLCNFLVQEYWRKSYL